MNEKIIIGLILLLVVGGGVFIFVSGGKSSDQANLSEENIKVDPELDIVISSTPDAVEENTETLETKGTGRYINYKQSELNFAKDGRVLLFFHAVWCPSCQTLDKDLKKQQKDGNIPDDLLIMKADFDTALALRKKYGITLQHSLVQVDSDGNSIRDWSGYYSQYTLEDLITTLNS